LSDPGFQAIRSELGRALEWQFYRQHSHSLHTLAEAERLIDWFRAQDPDEVQTLAIAAVTAVGAVADPWGAAVLHSLSKAIGVSRQEARVFIKDLETRGFMQIESMPVPLGAPGIKSFPRFCWWVACEPKRTK
jgi:hypothetical protein